MTSSPRPDHQTTNPSSSLLASPSKQTTRFYGTDYLREKTTTVNKKSPTKKMSAKIKQQQLETTWQASGNNVINTRKYFRDVYGPFLCSLLLISAFLVILGSVLMLAGFYVPALPEIHLRESESQSEERISEMIAIDKARAHNEALGGLRVSGVVLLSIGVIGLTILFLTPLVCLRRTEYSLLPPSAIDDVLPRSSFSSAASGLPDDMFTFSVVKQHIQPKNKSTGNKSRNSRTKQRPHYDKGLLSPELNRGPIFVSDDNFRIRNCHNDDDDEEKGNSRHRSSSFDSRLSPRYSPRSASKKNQRNSGGRYSISGTLTPDYTRSGPMKAGSFHSLR